MNDTTFQGNGKVVNVPVIFGAKPKPVTNADRIRAMSDEELADFMAKYMYCGACWKFDKEQGICTRTSGCNSAMLDWLKQEEET